MMKYKAVIFDLFGTLVTNVPLQENRRMLKKMASVLSINPDAFIQLWFETADERMKGIMKNRQENIEYICRQVGTPIEDKKIELAIQIRLDMIQSEVVPRADSIEVLSCLKSEGYKTGLISNCSHEGAAAWESTPFPAFIDVVVLSCLAGLQKPDPRIYQIAVEKLEVEPQGCIYIDDIGIFCAGAASVGMYPVLIRDPNEDSADVYRGDYDAEEWHGPTISSLSEVLELVR
jgi:putative hydrolase of the HAD superfamily